MWRDPQSVFLFILEAELGRRGCPPAEADLCVDRTLLLLTYEDGAVQGSDSSLRTLLLHSHTLVMWSAEKHCCHRPQPGPSEQGRSTAAMAHF